jgi:hypothetical protein
MFGALLRLFKNPCPSCGSRSLRNRNWIRATLVDDHGRRYPDSWAYESCDACHVRLKRYLDGRVETPSANEWQLYVDKGKGPQ